MHLRLFRQISRFVFEPKTTMKMTNDSGKIKTAIDADDI